MIKFIFSSRFIAGFFAGILFVAVGTAGAGYYVYKKYVSPGGRAEEVRLPDFYPVNRMDLSFEVYDLGGDKVDLGELKNHFAFIHFWATWCPPCMKELKHLDAIYKKHAADGLKMLVISAEPAGTLRQFARENSYSLNFLRADTIPARYMNEGVPRTLILDPSGAVIYNKAGAFDWDHPVVHNHFDSLLKRSGSGLAQ